MLCCLRICRNSDKIKYFPWVKMPPISKFNIENNTITLTYYDKRSYKTSTFTSDVNDVDTSKTVVIRSSYAPYHFSPFARGEVRREGGVLKYAGDPVTDGRVLVVFEGKLYVVCPPNIKECWLISGTDQDGVNSIITSQVVDMSRLFSHDTTFNHSVDAFDTSSVTDMSEMFAGAIRFNKPLNLQTQNVVSMSQMFAGATSFNSDVNFANTSNVEDMSLMFHDASSFNKPVNFNTSKVASMDGMFSLAVSFNQPIDFDGSSLVNTHEMFYGCLDFNSPLKISNTRNLKNASSMLMRARTFNQFIDIDLRNVTNLDQFLCEADSFDYPLRLCSLTRLQSAARMMARCESFSGLLLMQLPEGFNMQRAPDPSTINNRFMLTDLRPESSYSEAVRAKQFVEAIEGSRYIIAVPRES